MKRPETRPLYRSRNGDTWFLARDPLTELAFIRHQANAASGGQVMDMRIGDFLTGPLHPEHEALLRLIGTFTLDPHGAAADDEHSTENTSGDAELTKLGDMLVCGLSIEEIACLLRRDHNDVRDKVAEIGRACR